MSKIFNKRVEFHVEGEIYNDKDKTTPESIINSYTWTFSSDEGGNLTISGHHKDHRGSITKMTKLSGIKNWRRPLRQFLKM